MLNVYAPAWIGRAFVGWVTILRHEYHRIDDEVVWDTVKLELPPLRAAVVTALG